MALDAPKPTVLMEDERDSVDDTGVHEIPGPARGCGRAQGCGRVAGVWTRHWRSYTSVAVVICPLASALRVMSVNVFLSLESVRVVVESILLLCFWVPSTMLGPTRLALNASKSGDPVTG